MLNSQSVCLITTQTSNTYVTVTLSEIPINALRPATKNKMSILLNPRKILPTTENIPRDWRGLAHLTGIPGEDMPLLSNISDATGRILSEHYPWAKNSNVKELLDILEKLDRWDIIDDTKNMIDDDAHKYMSKVACIPQAINISQEEQDILTVDDVIRSQQGLSTQCYDAFVLYASEDMDFAMEMVERMENMGLKLCFKERDLIGGQLEHEAIMRLISERCNRLIIIVSPAFFESSANTFFINFAQAIGIEQGKRKIIPCVFKPCFKLPMQLNFYYRLHYNSKLVNFWDKLCISIKGGRSLSETTRCRTKSSVVIREIDQCPDKEIEIAHSLPKDFAVHPPNMEMARIEDTQLKDVTPIHTSLIDLSPFESTNVSESASSQELLPNSSGKSKGKKWHKKFMSNITLLKKDKKKIAVAL